MITIAIIIVVLIILILINTIIETKISLNETRSLVDNLERFKNEWKNKYTNEGEK